jgi:hypothetical protein
MGFFMFFSILAKTKLPTFVSITTDQIIHIRPRFHLQVANSVEEVQQLVSTTIKSEEFPCTGSIKNGFGVINILQQDQHFWSPQLTVTVEEVEGVTEIRGLYGPKPSVWTMFIFFYCVVGFSAIISTMVGLSNLSLEKPAGILWLTPVLIVLFLSIYLVSNFGKKLGKDQLVILHNFFEKALNIKVDDHLVEKD